MKKFVVTPDGHKLLGKYRACTILVNDFIDHNISLADLLMKTPDLSEEGRILLYVLLDCNKEVFSGEFEDLETMVEELNLSQETDDAIADALACDYIKIVDCE